MDKVVNGHCYHMAILQEKCKLVKTNTSIVIFSLSCQTECGKYIGISHIILSVPPTIVMDLEYFMYCTMTSTTLYTFVCAICTLYLEC